MAAVILPRAWDRGTGNQRDNGARNVALGQDAKRGVETSHQCWEETPLMCRGPRPDGPAAESAARRPQQSERWSCPEQSGGASFWQCLLFEVVGASLAHLFGDLLGAGTGGSSSKAEQALESWPSFVKVVAWSSLR